MIRRAYFSALTLLFVSSSAAAAPNPGGDCVVLDQMMREARTDFPALKGKHFGARCSYGKREYKCQWGFSTDKFVEAETQLDRLKRCTAAQPNAKPLTAKRGEAAFQINPETSVFMRGPDPDAGYWKIQLRINTTADWD